MRLSQKRQFLLKMHLLGLTWAKNSVLETNFSVSWLRECTLKRFPLGCQLAPILEKHCFLLPSIHMHTCFVEWNQYFKTLPLPRLYLMEKAKFSSSESFISNDSMASEKIGLNLLDTCKASTDQWIFEGVFVSTVKYALCGLKWALFLSLMGKHT